MTFHDSGLSSRPADGEVQQGGPHLGDAIHAPNSNSVAAAPLTSRRGRFNSDDFGRPSFINAGEIAAWCLVAGLLMSAAAIVVLSALTYMMIVA